MPDLVEKFFQQGLTEAEEEALSRELRVSEDTAEKFAQLAQQAYGRYGFSDPTVPDSFQWPPSAPPRAGWGPWIGLTVVLMGLGAVFFYRQPILAGISRAGALGPKSKVKSPAFLVKPEATGASGQEQRNDSAPPSGGGAPGNENLQVVKKGLETGEPKVGKGIQNSPTGLSVVAAATPLNLDEHPKARYSSISVLVHQPRPGPLKVIVLDTRGIEVTPLYEGTLGPGHWVFEWNGRLPNGQHAPAGFYLIQIQSGAYSQQKTVQIH